MSAGLRMWLELLALVAAEIGLMAGVAALCERFIKSGIWRRNLWQVFLVASLALLILEFSGTSRRMLARGGGQKSQSIATAKDKFGASSTPRLSQEFKERVLERASNKPAQASATEQSSAPPAALMSESQVASRSFNDGSLILLSMSLVWVLGAVVVLARTIGCRFAFAFLRSRWKEIQNPELRQRMESLAHRLGMKRRIRLIESSHFSSPVAFGVLWPTVGLPQQFDSTFTAAEQEAMLMHELAHLWANDPAWHLAADLMTAALWWHPLSWWARRRLHAASEIAADEASVILAGGPEVLASCLVTVGASVARSRMTGSMGIAGAGYRSGLGRRVERLLQLEGATWSPPGSGRALVAKVIAPVALIAIVTLGTAGMVPAALSQGENMQLMKQTWKKSLVAATLLTALGNDVQKAPAADAKPSSAIRDTNVSAIETEHNAPSGKQGQSLRAKLASITIDEAKFDNMPLSVVVQNLMEMSAAKDPQKLGVNFMLNRSMSQIPLPPGNDPATGLPTAPAVESVDLSSVTITLVPGLRHVRMIDLVDAITKVADHPIKCTVEDYAVVFSLDESKAASYQNAAPLPAPLFVRTFKVDTNTFFAGLENAFGIKAKPGAGQKSEETQAALRTLLQQLGISMDVPNKAIFYNGMTGIVMVRATQEDLTVVEAAIETLGGSAYNAGSGDPISAIRGMLAPGASVGGH